VISRLFCRWHSAHEENVKTCKRILRQKNFSKMDTPKTATEINTIKRLSTN